jgi:hypothetical protein
MSNLLTTAEGRDALIVAQRFQLQRRLARFFHRTVVIDFSRYRQGLSEFDLDTMLGALNTAHDSEILELFRLLGAVGGLSSSVVDMTYYVNATGSDTTGTGSILRPYASLWFIQNLPKRINHKIRIVLQSNISDPTMDLTLDFTFGGGGSFAIIGSGAPLSLHADVLDVAGLVPLQPGGGVVVNATGVFQPTDNQYFIRFTSGAAAGVAAPLHYVHLAYGVTNSFQWLNPSPAPADTFDICHPRYTLTLKSLNSFCKGNTPISSFGNRGSQLAIVNLQINFPAAGGPLDPTLKKFIWNNDCASTLSFVRFMDNWASHWNTIYGGSVNQFNLLDDQIVTLAASGIANLDHNTEPHIPTICGVKFNGGKGNQNLFVSNSNVNSFDCETIVVPKGRAEFHNCGFGVLRGRSANFIVDYSVMDGDHYMGNDNAGGIELYSCCATVEQCCVIDSDNVLVMYWSTDCTLMQVGSDASISSITNAGVWSEGACVVQAFYNDPIMTPVSAGMTGATGDLIGVTAGAPTTVAWPAVGGFAYFANSCAYVVR